MVVEPLADVDVNVPGVMVIPIALSPLLPNLR
jgi:hypothetical protein